MKNPNALISLAYIKINKNPLHIFCNYILYILLTASNQSLRVDEIKDRLKDKFGLDMPQLMLKNCTRMLKDSGDIVQMPNGGGYKIGATKFDTESFERTLLRLQEQEEVVLRSIVNFVSSRYKLSWSEDDARRYLSLFLGEEGNGARLFLYEEFPTDSKRISPSWYISKYVSDIQGKNESVEKQYLEEIINGMMIYQGIYQIGDYRQNKNQKYSGTVFYLDTKLVLRALGYSWSAQVEATKELISLITKKYDGKIGVFQQTIDEVQNALHRAGVSYDRREKAADIVDSELRMYAELNPSGATLLKEASTLVLPRLREEYDAVIQTVFDWNAPEVRRHSIEVKPIIEYIKSEKEWRPGAVTNDVEIINQINILRKGDYTVRYGGRSKLPVFLTTNVDLVFAFRKYIVEKSEKDTSSIWNIHALPIISDNMLLFRLWVPYANEYTSLPALTLSRYAYSAQNPNTQYFEKLRETATAYKEEKGIEFVDLTEMRRQQLEEILVTKSHGDSALLTADMVALSIDELVKMENISLCTQVTNLQSMVDNQGSELEKRDSRIIELASRPFVNKLGAWRLLIWCAQIWWIIITVLFVVGGKAAEMYANVALSKWWAIAAFPCIIAAILGVIDKLIDKCDVYHFMLKKAVGLTWTKYSRRIVKKLSPSDLIYKDQILKYCLNKTPILSKYQKYCVSDDAQ